MPFATYQERSNTAAVNNSYIWGALHTFYWSDVEPQEGVNNWSDLDNRIKPWVDGEKKVALRIMWSSNGRWPEPAAKHPTPQWLIQKGAVIATSPVTQTQVSR